MRFRGSASRHINTHTRLSKLAIHWLPSRAQAYSLSHDVCPICVPLPIRTSNQQWLMDRSGGGEQDVDLVSARVKNQLTEWCGKGEGVYGKVLDASSRSPMPSISRNHA
jgi:hypothetical protein